MSQTLSITLHDDGTITRDNDKKLLATAQDGEIKWEHWRYKDQHEDEAVRLLRMGKEADRDEINDQTVKAVDEGALSDDTPEPPKTFLGDLTPGYPEWVLKTQGQEAYDKRYVKRGKNRYEASKITNNELEAQKRRGFIN